MPANIANESLLTSDALKKILHYEAETGIFTWLVDCGNGSIGKSAGALTDKGYIRIRINGHGYRAGRLAWLYVTGAWPKDEIDHCNRKRADNSFDNLREATHKQNGSNLNAPTRNTSGYKGVGYKKQTNRWCAQIRLNGKLIHLGYFDTAEAAAETYVEAARIAFGSFSSEVTKP